MYDTQYPDNNSHDAATLIIRNNTEHYIHGHYQSEYIHAMSITIKDWLPHQNRYLLFNNICCTIKVIVRMIWTLAQLLDNVFLLDVIVFPSMCNEAQN